MKTLYLVFCSLYILVAVSGCDDNDVQPIHTGGSVKIGVIAPLTGADKAWGEKGLDGINTAKRLQPLLDNGSKIDFIIEDDQNNPELARKAFSKLVTENEVSSVLTLSNSESVLGLVELADTHKTPIFALSSTHPDVTKNNKFISQLLFDDDFQASVSALYVMDELLLDHVGVVIDYENPHSAYLARKFISKFESVGGTAEAISFTGDETAFQEKLKVVHNMKLDFIYTPLDADHVVTVARLLQTIDWHPIMMGSDGLASTLFLQHTDSMDIVKGMLVTDPYSTVLPATDYGRKVRKLYSKTFDSPGTGLAAMGCEGTSILISAINRCQDSNDRSCINRMLRSTDDFIGLFGKISVNGNGKSERPIFINTIQDSHLQVVVKVY